MFQIDETKCVNCSSCVRACPMGVLTRGTPAPVIHPDRRCIRCMHCAAACPRQAVCFDGLTMEAQYRPKPEDSLEALVQSRRSVRRFQDRLPDRALIQWALDTAAWAPSGKNQHANRWTVLWGKEETQRVKRMALDFCAAAGEAPELLKLDAAGVDLLTCGAPCLIVGWSPLDCLNPCLDTAVAMTTLELLLVSRGLSTCWGGYLRQVTDRCPALQAELGIPAGAKMQCSLMVGYAEGEKYPNIPYRPKAQANWVTADPSGD